MTSTTDGVAKTAAPTSQSITPRSRDQRDEGHPRPTPVVAPVSPPDTPPDIPPVIPQQITCPTPSGATSGARIASGSGGGLSTRGREIAIRWQAMLIQRSPTPAPGSNKPRTGGTQRVTSATPPVVTEGSPMDEGPPTPEGGTDREVDPVPMCGGVTVVGEVSISDKDYCPTGSRHDAGVCNPVDDELSPGDLAWQLTQLLDDPHSYEYYRRLTRRVAEGQVFSESSPADVARMLLRKAREIRSQRQPWGSIRRPGAVFVGWIKSLSDRAPKREARTQ